MDNVFNLGTGILTWHGAERRSDRYGAVWLMPDGCTSLTREEPANLMADICHELGQGAHRGTIYATIIESRESTHIGDMFRGISPKKTPEGTKVKLGEGTFFVEERFDCGGATVGVTPDDGRHDDWMNVEALYGVHEHLVNLTFERAA